MIQEKEKKENDIMLNQKEEVGERGFVNMLKDFREEGVRGKCYVEYIKKKGFVYVEYL